MRDLEFKLQPSKQYLAIMVAILLCSVAIIISLPVINILKLLLFSLLVSYGIWMMRQFVLLQAKTSIISLTHQEDKRWYLKTKQHGYEAMLLGDSTVTRWVSILRFRIPSERLAKSCIVFNDSLMRESYRRLLVTVRMF